jgi:hypothetical protein
MIRRTVIAIGLVAAFAGGAWTAQAQTKKDGHPLLTRAIEQLTNIKSRLQSAPKDFGGHKQKAIDAVTVATSELNQALQFDK